MDDGRDVFDNGAAVAADLEVLEQVLWSRAALHGRLVSESRSSDEAVDDVLRMESMAQFVEFFFLLKARGIETAEDVAHFADLHNAYLVGLHADKEKSRRLGLRADRLLDAIFTADTLPRLVEVWRECPGALDQSNLARFLAVVMSAETCRKLVLAAAAAGYLERWRSPHGAVLVRSTGAMERVFGSVMRDLRIKIQAIGGER
jgi:hypothetical protein